MVGLDRVKSLILQGIGAHLVGKANSATLLVQVEQHARTLGPHLGQCGLQLRTAIAFQRAQNVTGETGRMKPREDGAVAIRPTDFDRVMLFAPIFRAENMQPSGFGQAHRQARVHDLGHRARL